VPPVGPDRPEPWPSDPAVAVARLAKLIREIDARDRMAQDILLEDLLRAAWPTGWTQDQ
jgi:hypothetical protein